MRLVYIDDDADDCEIVLETIRDIDRDLVCDTYTDGFQALDDLYHTQTRDLPDFIFLDINMPRIGGKECLIRIKNSEKLKHIPVVMCSTTPSTREMKEFFVLGAHDFIVKPTSLSKFRDAFNSILYSPVKRVN